MVIDPEFRDLVERPIVAVLATIGATDGVQVTPVWTEYVSGRLLLSIAASTQKARNVAANRAVGLCYVDPDNPYRYLQVRGEVTDMSPLAAHEHLDRMSQRYWGVRPYPDHDYSQERLLVTVTVLKSAGLDSPVAKQFRAGAE